MPSAAELVASLVSAINSIEMADNSEALAQWLLHVASARSEAALAAALQQAPAAAHGALVDIQLVQ